MANGRRATNNNMYIFFLLLQAEINEYVIKILILLMAGGHLKITGSIYYL